MVSWFDFIIVIIGGIIGAVIGLTPFFWEKFKKVKIEGKMTSKYVCLGKLTSGGRELDGTLYCLKLSIIALNKNFNLKKIEVNVVYPDENQEYKGWIIWTRKASFTFNEGGNEICKTLNISNEEVLLSNIILPKDKPVVGFLIFGVNNKKNSDFKKIIIKLIDWKGEEVKIDLGSPPESELYFDDKIWV